MIKGKGRLRHCGWLIYHATIVLKFDNEAEAKIAHKALGNHWEIIETNKSCIRFHGAETLLEEVLSKLESFGASRNVICSMAKSIDFGEPFEIIIEENENANS